MTSTRSGAAASDEPGRKPRARRPAVASEPLGSLSQGDDLAGPGGSECRSCRGTLLTQLRMVLGDGTPVVFVSCHQCEQRTWFALDGTGDELTREDVLERSAKR
ncbi:hypothetical protein BH11ACT1_BH11ACT1_26460 [soil metagenome]